MNYDQNDPNIDYVKLYSDDIALAKYWTGFWTIMKIDLMWKAIRVEKHVLENSLGFEHRNLILLFMEHCFFGPFNLWC
jgi:hypothetical protein